jgi:hypothetical protein
MAISHPSGYCSRVAKKRQDINVNRTSGRERCAPFGKITQSQ